MKKIASIVFSTLLLSNTVSASVDGATRLQEKAARVIAQELEMTRDQINELNEIFSENAPIGDLDKCTAYGYLRSQQMAEKMPSMSDKLTDAMQKFVTWGCVVKNGG